MRILHESFRLQIHSKITLARLSLPSHRDKQSNLAKNMKKTLITTIAVLLAAATQVGAVTVNVTEVSGYNVGQGGGEFNVNPVIGVGYAPSVVVGGGFETFCLSRDEGIIVPGTYNATVNANSVYDLNNTTTKTMAKGTAYPAVAGSLYRLTLSG